MIVTNAVTPGPEQAAAFFGGEEGPFVMVNLLKFREHAAYPDGRDAHLTGFEAYLRYGMAVGAHVERVGGKTGYAGRVTGLMIGQVGEAGELWDMVALVQYPSLAAMREMIAHPEYQAISVHRTAGLAGQLNIKTQGAAL